MLFSSPFARGRRAITIAAAALVSAALPAHALLSPSASRAATTATSSTCMANPLAAATGYDEFILGNASRGAESEGAVAYGGTLTTSSMTVGSRLSATNTSFPSLVVAGGTSGSFNLQAGSAYLGGRTSGVNFNGGGSYLSSDPIDFASAFQTLQSNADSWAATTPNGTTEVISPGADGTPAMGGSSSLLLSGTDPTLDVFSVTPAELDGSAAIFVDVPTGATALINVSGSGAVTVSGTLEFWNGSSYGQPDNFSEGSGVSNQVTDTVWNFPSSTTVNLDNGDAFGGTIVAPQATVNAVSIGHNNGAVIAAAFNSNFETHNYLLPSNACLPAGGQGTTTPAEAELHVSKSASATSVGAGHDVTYTVGAANAGQAAAANVELSDTLPAGMTFVSAGSDCSDSGQTVTCAAGTIAAGGSTSFKIVAEADQVSAPTTTHDQLTVVKAEQYITAQAGQTVTTDLSCGSGMFATDASVEVVHVDQGTGTLEDVHVDGLYQLSDGTYEAVVTNNSSGQAQAELYAACIGDKTEQGYPLEVTGELNRTSTLTAGTHTIALNCGAGRTPVAPSFDITSGNAAETAVAPNATNEQDLTVQVGAGGAQVVVGMRCLEDETGLKDGAVEQLGFTRVSRPVTVPVDQYGQDSSYQVSCGDIQKGIVGGWKLPAGLFSMGNEPQPKIRLFWIDNPSGQSLSGNLYLLCVNEYLGRATGVARLTNTVTGSTTSAQDANAVLSASATVTVSNVATATGTPTITIDPESAELVRAMSSRAFTVNARGQVCVALKLTTATSGTVTLRSPKAIHMGAVKLKAGARLSHARVKTKRARTVTIRLQLTHAVRHALHRLHRTALMLIFHIDGHRAHVTLRLKNP